jgi:hypothetical protein
MSQKQKGRSFWLRPLNFLPELGRSARSRSFMGWLDIVDLTACHEITGIIAVHHKQFNFMWRKSLFGGVLLVCASAPVLAAAITQPSKPDPLLDGGPTSLCAASPDYAAGTDANGQPVVPADVAAGRVPLPDAVAIPLGDKRSANRRRLNPGTPGDSAYVSLGGQKLEPLLNPAPCIDPGR